MVKGDLFSTEMSRYTDNTLRCPKICNLDDLEFAGGRHLGFVIICIYVYIIFYNTPW